MMTIETISLTLLARGCVDRLRYCQNLLRSQEANGDIRIHFMDDEIAQIAYLNPAWARNLSTSGVRVQ